MNKPNYTAEPGKEYISENEEVIIEDMLSLLVEEVDHLYADKKMLRQIHTKMHGCVKAVFEVEPNLPEHLRIGIFKEPKTYHSWVRFSNSQTEPKPDKKKDIRGIAIKLMGVPGEKVLSDEQLQGTQDFLLMTSETFFSHNIHEFQKILKALKPKKSLSKIIAFIFSHFDTFKRLKKSMVNCQNPLTMQYWSTQPYQFGQGKAVKYYLEPSSDNRTINENFKDHDYLRVNMAQTLNNQKAVFNFYVQLQENAETMPIEDPTVPWNSPFQKVATLTIPPQEFDTPEQMEFGEDLSFNSWHSLPAHRPLGSFNRARKRIYQAMSDYRHKKNGIPVFEPRDSSDFITLQRDTAKYVTPRPIPQKKVLKRSAQVVINCDKQTAFDFFISSERLPDWLKKDGPIPAAEKVEIINGPYDHIGATRKVFFDNGGSIFEELLAYNPNANYAYQVTEFTNFLRHLCKIAYARLWFDRVGDHTRVTWEYTLTYKNIFARVLLSMVLTFRYKGYLQRSLLNAKACIENG